jgi:hypothetical protein
MTKVKTSKLTDIRDNTDPRYTDTTLLAVQAKLDLSVSAYTINDRQNMINICNDAHEAHVKYGYGEVKIKGMLRRSFCKAYCIPAGEKYGKGSEEETQYHSFSSLVPRIAKVACRTKENYNDLLNCKSFNAMWIRASMSDKKIKNIVEGKESVDHKAERLRKQLEKDKAEGVVNAPELLAGMTSKPELKVVPKPEEKKDTSYIAPNADLVWVQDSRKICRQSPELFVRMIKSCMDNGYLSEVSYNSIKEDLLK